MEPYASNGRLRRMSRKGLSMRRVFVCTVTAVLVAAGGLADQITMKDGDRITGNVVKKDGDAVTIKSKNFGEVKLKWSEVAEIRTDQTLNVVLGDETVKANIQSQGSHLQVGALSVTPDEITAVRNDDEQKIYERFRHPGLLDLWVISGNLSIAGARGNAETSTLMLPLNFTRASNTSRTTAYFNTIRASATVAGLKAQTANAVRGGWGYNRNLTKRIFLNGFNDYESDKFQSLNLRTVLGGGAGYSVRKGEFGQLSVVGGIAWNREAFSASSAAAAFTRSSAQGYWGDDFSYKLSSRASLTEAFRMFNNLSDSGNYRTNLDFGATTQLVRWLNWNIDLGDRYLTNPAPGRKKNDLLYSTGFGFSFAH